MSKHDILLLLAAAAYLEALALWYLARAELVQLVRDRSAVNWPLILAAVAGVLIVAGGVLLSEASAIAQGGLK